MSFLYTYRSGTTTNIFIKGVNLVIEHNEPWGVKWGESELSSWFELLPQTHLRLHFYHQTYKVLLIRLEDTALKIRLEDTAW